MDRTPQEVSGVVSPEHPQAKQSDSTRPSQSRRKFLSKVGIASVAAGVLGGIPEAIAQPVKVATRLPGGIQALTGGQSNRVAVATALRIANANADAALGPAPHTTSGDEQRYSDHSASYSKALLQDSIGVVNQAAWESFKKACNSGKNSDWEAVINGGTRTHNGPQGSYAFDMECPDSSQFGNVPSPGDPTGLPVVGPFWRIAGKEYAAELIEQFWGSQLRDVAFTDYATNATAQAAAAELDKQPAYKGPRDSSGHVTTDNLFRGPFAGETIGPYMSQFMILPTNFGRQPLDQLMVTALPGIDYMTDTTSFFQVQNGISTGLSLQLDTVRRYLHDGRGLTTWTHDDVLYQGYLIAMLVLGTLKAPLNPGNPYIGSKTQNGFDTFGGPDFAASMGECASKGLHKVWYQKWLVHLVHRPEAGAGVLHSNLTGGAALAKIDSSVANSQAVANNFSKYGTYLLPQSFPEGSPAHPCYPTGHGTVGGAAITFLKFFFDENFVIPNPMVPTSDGLSLVPYTGSDAGQITVGGELNKLMSNVSFGHGIHAGIHWRKSTYNSNLLGEAMAIGMLQDRAKTYNEKFSVTFTKLDGNKVTISNQ
ncbi:MAG TPA: vanadium-dependent haloperoxidase [Terriglobales bacterium]|nr:vanadium-dependent haloperoxidase [Terriglobales bacterium]